ncbi:unnamed protein product [Caretta caretta]
MLLENGAGTSQRDANGCTQLATHGANINHADRKGWTVLRSAAWGGHAEAVAGTDVDSQDTEDHMALRAAAWGSHEDIGRTLLAHGAQVNWADTEGRTALIAAACMGRS